MLTAPQFLPSCFLSFKKAVGGIDTIWDWLGRFFFFFCPRGYCQTMQYKPLWNERLAALASTAARPPLLSYSFHAPYHAKEDCRTKESCMRELFLSMSSHSQLLPKETSSITDMQESYSKIFSSSLYTVSANDILHGIYYSHFVTLAVLRMNVTKTILPLKKTKIKKLFKSLIFLPNAID